MDARAVLKRLRVETGATIVYVTRDQLEALTMSTHVATGAEHASVPPAPRVEA